MQTVTYNFEPGQDVYILTNNKLKNYGLTYFVAFTKIVSINISVDSLKTELLYTVRLPSGGITKITEDNIYDNITDAMTALENTYM